MIDDSIIGPLLDAAYKYVADVVAIGESVGKSLPDKVKRNIDAWNFGGYGWTSPVNLLMTAAWVKHADEHQDVCLIWARNTQGPIPGGFSMRSMDEKFTVSLVNKYTIFDQFCSSNSGMQGTRALEKNKLREAGTRIERDSELGQSVRFDIVLFQNILNDINDSDSEQALLIFQYFIEIAINVKQRIANEMGAIPQSQLAENITVKKTIIDCVESFKDPQFVKIVVAAIFDLQIEALPKLKGCSLNGVEGAQTSADTQSGNPGDLWIENQDGSVIAGCEVKDMSKTIGFDVLAAINKRTREHPNLKQYFLISASKVPIALENLIDPQWDTLLSNYASKGIIVSALSVIELLNITCFFSDITLLPDKISTFLKVTSNLKSETIVKWAALMSAD